MIDKTIFDEAARCLGCKNAACKNACPVNQEIPKVLALLKNNQSQEAFNTLLCVNPLFGICADVCPHSKNCQGACLRAKVDKTLQIGKIESALFDEFSSTMLTVTKTDNKLSGKKVAIVGSGPAGLVCAWHLQKSCAEVTVFEKNQLAGGILTYGIPSFRLDKKKVFAVVNALKDAGAKFVFNIQVKDLNHLSQNFDAVVLATGLQKDNRLGVEGENLLGVVCSTDFLKNPTAFKNVLVVGGGNSAIDAARTAKKHGANVTVVYRRTEAEMPAFCEEVLEAKNDGVDFKFLLSPKKINGKTNVESMTFSVNILGQKDSDGRARPVETGEFLTLACDGVIVSVGCSLEENLLLDSCLKIENGRIKSSPSMYAGHANIFVAGDNANRQNTVVAACYDGKTAACAVLELLTQKNCEQRLEKNGEKDVY